MHLTFLKITFLWTFVKALSFCFITEAFPFLSLFYYVAFVSLILELEALRFLQRSKHCVNVITVIPAELDLIAALQCFYSWRGLMGFFLQTSERQPKMQCIERCQANSSSDDKFHTLNLQLYPEEVQTLLEYALRLFFFFCHHRLPVWALNKRSWFSAW